MVDLKLVQLLPPSVVTKIQLANEPMATPWDALKNWIVVAPLPYDSGQLSLDVHVRPPSWLTLIELLDPDSTRSDLVTASKICR